MIACVMVIAISPFSMVIMIKLKHSIDRPPRSPGVEAMSNHKGLGIAAVSIAESSVSILENVSESSEKL